jgi:hypothetical protein
VFGIPGTLHRDLRGGRLDLSEVLGSEFEVSGFEVLAQALGLRRSRDRDDPRLPGEQPGERDLSRGCVLPFPFRSGGGP